jgi:hypothetical protein
MNNLVMANGKIMNKAEKDNFLILVKSIFAIGANEIDAVAIEHNLKGILTKQQKEAFIDFAESELVYMQRQEERSNFQKNNRLEKFNIICRKFNQEVRLAESKYSNKPLLQDNSVEHRFASTLDKKLKSALRDMRAIRELVRRNQEHYKKIHFTDIESIVDTTDYSILSTILASNNPDNQVQADTFITLVNTKKIDDLVDAEVDRRCLNLARRKDMILKMKADSNEAVMRVNLLIDDMRKRKTSLKHKVRELYEFVSTNRLRNWEDSKKLEHFMTIDPETGKKVKTFSDKEINALNHIGDWDKIIRIIDQDTLKEAVYAAFKQAKNDNKMLRKSNNHAAFDTTLNALVNDKRV